MDLKPGDKLDDRYQLLSKIGEGGMGEVWRALDTRLNRDVAIKTSRAGFSSRFKKEAEVIASLNHNNICILHDVGADYLVMEYIEGPTLAERISQGPIPLDEALVLAKQIGKRNAAIMPAETPEAQQEQSRVTFLLNFADELQRKVPAK